MFRSNKKMTDKNEKKSPEEEFPDMEATGQPNRQDGEKDKKEAAQLKKDLEELNDKYIRLYSEFDNYKRRTLKERQELVASAGKDLMIALLPVLDDFERAEKFLTEGTDIKALREGVDLIQSKMKNILTQNGLKPLDSIGQAFDLDLHEAVTTIPAPKEDMKGKVVDEVERGYLLNGKVIRFAKVVLGE
jgi:molecular chaperone GrpE